MKPSRRRRVIVALLVVATLATLWLLRAPLLTRVGALLVEEGRPARAEAIVVFSSHPAAAAVEAAELYRAGYGSRVLVLTAPPDPDDRVLARLGVEIPPQHERAVFVLGRLGVPRNAITLEPGGDGTNNGVRALARWAEAARARRLLVVADRSHTRRVATLLRAQLPSTTIVMRASHDDSFDPTRWWSDRTMAREVAIEGLRWVNSVVFGDLWAAGAQSR